MPPSIQPPPPEASAIAHLGWELRLRRTKMACRIDQLAGKLGYSAEVVRKIETGTYRAKPDGYVARWAELFGLDARLRELWARVQDEDEALRAAQKRAREADEARRAGVGGTVTSGQRTALLPPHGRVGNQPDESDAHGIVVAAAQQSGRFGAWVESTNLSRTTLERLYEEVVGLATDFVHSPALPVLTGLVTVRDPIFYLLEGSRQHPADSRRLYFLAGTVCAMLAGVSNILGNPVAAMMHARTAWVCAEQADHPALRASVLGTRALIAEWTGRCREAVRLARAGNRHAAAASVPGTVAVRLASLEGRALGRLGAEVDAVAALRRAGEARDRLPADPDHRDEVDQIGGIFTFPVAKQRFYAGSAYVKLHNPAEAQAQSLAAIAAYQTGPAIERSYGDEGLARIDVAAARLQQHDLDGVAEALAPVFALPTTLRIKQLGTALGDVRHNLTVGLFRRSAIASEIREAIEHFEVPAISGELTTG
jgi:hypothetical protein